MSIQRRSGTVTPPVRMRYALGAILLCMVLAGCGGDSLPTGTPPPTQPLNPALPTATAAPIIPTPTLTPPPSAAEIAQTAAAQGPTPDATEQARSSLQRIALQAASADSGVPVSALEIISVTGVRAGREIGSCGRTRSGMALAYVRREDRAIELLIDGQTATVCATASLYDERPDLFLLVDHVAAELVQLATQRAARAAGVDSAEVILNSVRPMIWPDGSLGCTATATPAPEAPGVAGYRIVLAAGDAEYVYHTDFDRIVPCVMA